MPLERDEYSVTNFRNMDDLSSSSLIGVSNSATRPTNALKIKFSDNMCGSAYSFKCQTSTLTVTENQNKITIDNSWDTMSNGAYGAVLELGS